MNVHPGFAHMDALASRRTQAGVGLIEVLLAVLILSIGFLGTGALLAVSLSTNNTAMSHSMATVASYSILDAMRADLDHAVSGDYNTTITADDCDSISGSDLVDTNLQDWCEHLADNLGERDTTTGTIDCTASSSSATATCTITVSFDARAERNADKSAQNLTQTVVTKGKL